MFCFILKKKIHNSNAKENVLSFLSDNEISIFHDIFSYPLIINYAISLKHPMYWRPFFSMSAGLNLLRLFFWQRPSLMFDSSATRRDWKNPVLSSMLHSNGNFSAKKKKLSYTFQLSQTFWEEWFIKHRLLITVTIPSNQLYGSVFRLRYIAPFVFFMLFATIMFMFM